MMELPHFKTFSSESISRADEGLSEELIAFIKKHGLKKGDWEIFSTSSHNPMGSNWFHLTIIYYVEAKEPEKSPPPAN